MTLKEVTDSLGTILRVPGHVSLSPPNTLARPLLYSSALLESPKGFSSTGSTTAPFSRDLGVQGRGTLWITWWTVARKVLLKKQ